MKTNMLNKIVTILTTLIYSGSLFGQTLSFDGLYDYYQNVRIGLVDEFFDRFNGTTTHPDIKAGKIDSRINNLMMLYDLSQFSSKNDSSFHKAKSMMEVVMNDSIQINYTDSTWAAIAHCKGTLSGKAVKFDLFLTVQHRKENMYKWVISKADGNIFNITPKNTNEGIMLHPDDHEINFMSLKRMTKEQPYNIQQFMVKAFDYDKTSVFAYLVYSKLLKIDYVEDLEFVFTNVPGYMFHVSYFERERNNVGWLISKFYESSDENKISFIKELRPLYAVPLDDCLEVVNASPANEVKDSVSLQNSDMMKEMYEKRLKEKLFLLSDYISFMQTKKKSSDLRQFWANKFDNLFTPNSKVTIKKDEQSVTLSIPEFCQNVINRKYKNIELDSIMVPIWDNKIAALDSSIYMIEAPSCCFDFHKNNILEEIVSGINHGLFIYKEDTEDGIEWLPMFGDLYVTIK